MIAKELINLIEKALLGSLSRDLEVPIKGILISVIWLGLGSVAVLASYHTFQHDIEFGINYNTETHCIAIKLFFKDFVQLQVIHFRGYQE